ncbi:MAG: glycosyltransferase family 1 protein [Bacteroidetes bacterium]|nr:glycosyltransferase family 1 protein [Bacteroidota bacterium]
MEKAINIVSFNVPYPPNYGGIIDVFYKIKYLHQSGVKVYLHCFDYGRGEQSELNNYCEKVYYYRRSKNVLFNFFISPYNVITRQSNELLSNLLLNNYPILFEVLYSCELLKHQKLRNRFKIYRHSNIEHVYFNELAKVEHNFLKKIYLKLEAKKLQRFEKIVSYANLILAVNKNDTLYFQKKYKNVKTCFLPSFHENNSIKCEQGLGNYFIYHANLSVAENIDAAFWLIENVIIKSEANFIIAGLNPPKSLMSKVAQLGNCKLIQNPLQEQMLNLILNAHCQILFTKQSTGLKLKLLNALFCGRFVLCNSAMLVGSSLEKNETLFLAENSEQYLAAISKISKISFSQGLILKRSEQLSIFSNDENIKALMNLIPSTNTL